jgi:hypothetical protein
MSVMNRTVLAFVVGAAITVPVGVLADNVGVGSWGMTGIAVLLMFLVSLIDREGFYGPRDNGAH